MWLGAGGGCLVVMLVLGDCVCRGILLAAWVWMRALVQGEMQRQRFAVRSCAGMCVGACTRARACVRVRVCACAHERLHLQTDWHAPTAPDGAKGDCLGREGQNAFHRI